MKVLFLAPVVLSIAILGAHFMRYGNVIGVAASLVLIGLVFLRRAWVARLIQVALVLGALEWMHTLYELMQLRMAQGAPTARMTAILGVVIVITLGSALLFQTKTLQRMYGLQGRDKAAPFRRSNH
jgi:predicted Abi (CAAX) family protease